ncbi:MAG: DMT family transporter [Pseudomonadota bacterium]
MGEALALLTAVTWSVGVILFRMAGREVGPFALNVFKNTVALILLGVSMPILSQAYFPSVPLRDILILLATGVIGIGISDTLFLYTLNVLGAGRTALVDCLYSPFVILFAFYFLGERLTGLQSLGGAFILAGVVISAMERSGHKLPLRTYVKGLAAGTFSMASMGAAVVMMKPLLNTYPIMWVNTVRMAGGLAFLALFLPFQSRWSEVRAAFRPGRSWRVTLPASIVASYVSLVIWVAGMKYTETSIAALLNQTSVVLIVILAALFLREPFTRVRTIAVAMAVGGSILIVW